MFPSRDKRRRFGAHMRACMIADLTRAWRFWSLRLSMLGAALSAGWIALPPDTRALVPGSHWIGLCLFLLVALARLIDQPGARR